MTKAISKFSVSVFIKLRCDLRGCKYYIILPLNALLYMGNSAHTYWACLVVLGRNPNDKSNFDEVGALLSIFGMLFVGWCHHYCRNIR